MHSQIVDRIIDEPGLEMGFFSHKTAGCDHLIHDESGMICCELKPSFLAHFVHNRMKYLIR